MLQEHNNDSNTVNPSVAQPGGAKVQELMTEQELIGFLRIPEISKATDHHNVISNLKRMHDLPCIHLCKQPLYPLNAVRAWIGEKVLKEQKR